MPKYLVGFDGKWQQEFADLDEALTWGREVGQTERIVHGVRRRILRSELIAVFPESKVAEGRRLWQIRASGAGYGGGKIW